MTTAFDAMFEIVDTGYSVHMPDYHGEGDFSPIQDSRHRVFGRFTGRFQYTAEEAAQKFAENLCGDDPDWYRTVESGGILLVVKAPDGSIVRVRVTGEQTFSFYTTEE